MDKVFINLCSNGNLDHLQGLWYSKQKPINIHAENEKAFINSCRNGHLNVAQWLHMLGSLTGATPINIHAQEEKAFVLSCVNNHLEIAKWLLTLDNTINIRAQNNRAFICSGRAGHLEVIKWLWLKTPIMDLRAKRLTFWASCANGKLEVVKWLLSLSHGDCIESSVLEQGFINSCRNGHFETAQWLYQNYSLNPHAQYDEAFLSSCGGRHLDIAKWLYGFEIKSNIIGIAFNHVAKYGYLEFVQWLMESISDAQEAFISSCQSGQFEVAEWLFDHSNIDDATKSNAFIASCEEGHLNVAKWLSELYPKKFYLESDNEKIICWFVINHIPSDLKLYHTNNNLCCICYENENNTAFNCGHQLCLPCFNENKSVSKCYFCRKPINRVFR